MTTMRVIHLEEPPMLFAHQQAQVDPRDGLTLFGPLEEGKPAGIRWAVIGTPDSISRMTRWVSRMESPIASKKDVYARPVFPGFQAAYRCRLDPTPVLQLPLSDAIVHEKAHLADQAQRVFQTVELFTSAIIGARHSEDVRPDVWYVVIPEYIHQNCRPRSSVPLSDRTTSDGSMNKTFAHSGGGTDFLFEGDKQLAKQYQYDVDFHHQLKARLLQHKVATQIIRETTIAHRDFPDVSGNPIRKLDDQESAIAWNLANATFYKAGGRPWKLGAARPGVCYIGLVFKRNERDSKPNTACCAAQMFLDSGDGVVFRGAVGPWFNEKWGDFHLTSTAAQQVVAMCVESYEAKMGVKPTEIFIHGKVTFHDEEWRGFERGAGGDTRVVGVKIRHFLGLKLYRLGDYPVLRGTALLENERKGFLWTSGMTQRLKTYPGREVPNPLLVEVVRGNEDIVTVMSDVLALTKLNYNSCKHSDGLPVTLRFADAVGEILTAAPSEDVSVPPLPFMYYI